MNILGAFRDIFFLFFIRNHPKKNLFLFHKASNLLGIIILSSFFYPVVCFDSPFWIFCTIPLWIDLHTASAKVPFAFQKLDFHAKGRGTTFLYPFCSNNQIGYPSKKWIRVLFVVCMYGNQEKYTGGALFLYCKKVTTGSVRTELLE
jgi:hypothetical protein